MAATAAIIEAIVALEPEVQALIISLIRKIHAKKNPLAAVEHAHAAMAMEPERDPTDLES